MWNLERPYERTAKLSPPSTDNERILPVVTAEWLMRRLFRTWRINWKNTGNNFVASTKHFALKTGYGGTNAETSRSKSNPLQ